MKANEIREFQKERHGHLGCCKSRIFRDIRYHHAVLSCGLKIDNVIAGRENADIFKVRELLKGVPVKDCLVRDRRFGALHPFNKLFLGCCVVSRNFAQVFQCAPGDVARVSSRAVKNHYLHEYFLHTNFTNCSNKNMNKSGNVISEILIKGGLKAYVHHLLR